MIDLVHTTLWHLASHSGIARSTDHAPTSINYSTWRHFRFRHTATMTSSSPSHVTRRRFRSQHTATLSPCVICGRHRVAAPYGLTTRNVAPPTSTARTCNHVISRCSHNAQRQVVNELSARAANTYCLRMLWTIAIFYALNDNSLKAYTHLCVDLSTGIHKRSLVISYFTVRLHVMQRAVLLSQFCPSVRQTRVLWQN